MERTWKCFTKQSKSLSNIICVHFMVYFEIDQNRLRLHFYRGCLACKTILMFSYQNKLTLLNLIIEDFAENVLFDSLECDFKRNLDFSSVFALRCRSHGPKISPKVITIFNSLRFTGCHELFVSMSSIHNSAASTVFTRG